MKKVIPFILLMFMFSCKKDYTCTCTEPDGDSPVESYSDLDRNEAAAAKLGCELSSGFGTTCVWEKN